MPVGLRLPVGVNSSGGFALVESDENDKKIIYLALADDDNENAFQQNIGLGSGMIFDNSDQQLRGKVQRKLLEIFRRFEAQKRYILRVNTIRWEENPDTQELTLSFFFLNIESNEDKEFRESFTAAGPTTKQT